MLVNRSPLYYLLLVTLGLVYTACNNRPQSLFTVTNENVEKKSNNNLERLNIYEKQILREQEEIDPALEKEQEDQVLKRLNDLCRKHGDLDSPWGAAPCNTLTFYNKLRKYNEEKARKIIIKLPKTVKTIDDLEKTTAALMIALGKNPMKRKAYERRRNSVLNLIAQHVPNFPGFNNRAKDAYKWRHPPYEKVIMASLKKIKKKKKKTDKLLNAYKDRELERLLEQDRRKELKEGQQKARENEDANLIVSYELILKSNRPRKYAVKRRHQLKKAALKASKGAKLSKKQQKLADEWLEKDYTSKRLAKLKENFGLNEGEYEELVSEVEMIENAVWALTHATMAKGHEKGVEMLEYKERLETIEGVLKDLEEDLKKELDTYNFLERVGMGLKNALKFPFKKSRLLF